MMFRTFFKNFGADGRRIRKEGGGGKRVFPVSWEFWDCCVWW